MQVFGAQVRLVADYVQKVDVALAVKNNHNFSTDRHLLYSELAHLDGEMNFLVDYPQPVGFLTVIFNEPPGEISDASMVVSYP